MLSIQQVINQKLLRWYFNILFFFHIMVFLVWCIFSTYSTSQLGLVTFRVANGHIWLMAMIPDSTALEEDDSELSYEWVTQNRKLENKLEREESRKDE